MAVMGWCRTNTDPQISFIPRDTPLRGKDSLVVKRTLTPTTILLDSAVDLMFEIYLLRGDCSAAATALTCRRHVDNRALEECALLDDALAQTYRSLQATVRKIQKLRAARGTRAK